MPLNAAGLQIPGVIDDLYPYDGELGVSIEDGDSGDSRVGTHSAAGTLPSLLQQPNRAC